jgi:hypothetical protein
MCGLGWYALQRWVRDLVAIPTPFQGPWEIGPIAILSADKEKYVMKKIAALAVIAFASQVAVAFAGEPMVSSKQVIAPPPSFFRPSEMDLGLFGTYATGVGSGENAGKLHAWGEGSISLIGSHGNMLG